MTTEAPAGAASFADLGVSDHLVDALATRGITSPFEIQTLTIPDGLAGRDVCGKAQTGSGKTLAFGIPLVTRTGTGGSKRPTGLVLAPTRELAAQVAEELRILAAAGGQRVVTVYGGAPMHEQIEALERGVEIVVATPGRLIDLADRKKVFLDGVSTVVIDEADQMADMGFLPQVHAVMRLVGGTDQTMLFSATLDGAVQSLVNSYLEDPVRYEAEDANEVVDTQEHRFIQVHHMDKARVVASIAEGVGRVLVFVRTKRNADKVAKELRNEGIEAEAIHGDRRQNHRERALRDFQAGKKPVLVATNVAARGLHIDDVDVVIHYDPPQDYKTFVHRSGRTARAGEEGVVVTLVEWDQIEEVQRLQKASGLHYEIVKMYSNDDRLGDLSEWEPDEVDLRLATDVDLSRRFRMRRKRR
ncbi:MAG: DEAD/DEAH box helicase [Acidimicrobiia bacterium]|nr:DEAD/DEAH box helicase [Acidimicrobiia bacterium]